MENSGSGKMDRMEKVDVRKISTEFFNISHGELMALMEGQEEEFQEFCQARVSFDTLRIVAGLFFLISAYFYGMALIHAKSRALIVVAGGSLFLVRNPLFMALIYIKNKLRRGTKTPFVLQGAKWVPFFASLLSVHGSTSLGLYLIARVLNGPCENMSQLYSWGCNPEAASHALPQDTLYCVLFTPILYAVIFKAIEFRFVVFSWFMAVTSVVISIVLGNHFNSIPILLIYAPISIVVLYENFRQNVILFLISSKQQALLEQNKILADETQSELRFMIANMAHDLKTPLSAFVNGVEILSSLFSDLKKPGISSEKVKALNGSIHDNIKNLFTVNNFMVMTVNRCIDYMKASKGIKLEPRLETINLQEVLSMPLNCMRDLQSRIAIVQRPIPVNVCSHIITDLQWFQENLFCLISNAVKYSSHGHVSITVEKVGIGHHLLVAAKEKKAGRLSLKSSNSEDSVSENPTTHHEPYAFLDTLLTLSKDEKDTVRIDDTLNRMELGVLVKPEARPDVVKHASRRFKKGGAVYAAAPSSATQQMIESHMRRDEHSKEEKEIYLLIEVEDTGIGLSDEVKQTLFKPFKQAQRRAGGTGLGLYSLAKRVDALGGYYGVSNRRDGEQGSIFWFAVPYRADPGAISSCSSTSKSASLRMIAEETPQDPAEGSSVVAEKPHLPDRGITPGLSHTPTGSTPEGSVVSAIHSSLVYKALTHHAVHTDLPGCDPPSGDKLRVLLVDDSLTILKMTSNLLKRHGHVVDQEENGADALARLEKSRNEGIKYDIVLMDLNMPVMDGLEAMKRLRESERQMRTCEGGVVNHHQMIFAFSANSDRETMAEAMEAGADDFMCKPFSIQTFNERYARMMNDEFHTES